MDEQKNQMQMIAKRLAFLRQIAGMTQQQLAAIAGVTPEAYASAEAGESDFSFTFLYKCASALGVGITDLVTGENARLSGFCVTRAGEGMPIERRHGFKYCHLAANFKNRVAEPFLVTAPYSADEESGEIPTATHAGEEMDYIISGTLRVSIGGNISVLREGDTIYYDSKTPHGMVAAGGVDCTFIAVVIPPVGEKSVYTPVEQLKPVRTLPKEDNEKRIWQQFVSVTENADGDLESLRFTEKDNFNFAFDVVDALALKCPDKTAMMYVDKNKDDRRFTFEDMSRYSSKTANYFLSLGIRPGDRVMLVLKRHYQFWFSILALHKIGAVAIPATDQLVCKDYVYRFNAAGVSAVICTGEGESMSHIDEALPESPTLRLRVRAGGEAREGWENFGEGVEAASDVFERSSCGEKSETDTMLMFFSSGTTGYPKIASHDFRYPLGHFITAKYWHLVNPDGLHFTIADTGWGKALWGKLYGQWLCEAPIFTFDFDRFHADDVLPMFAKYHITTFCAPPTIYRFLIKEDITKYDLSSIESATVAGEALNPEVYNRFYDATGLKIREGFGQTETTLVIYNRRGEEPRPGSMGKPSPLYNVVLHDGDGNPCKTGEVGEIVINTEKGAPRGLYKGYFRDEEKTRAAWHDGWYHTGDTAWCDEDGYFWYVGRVDDLIKSSGYRIGPFEIESVIMELPYVLECAVTGVPDEIRGQVVKATIVLTKNTEGTDELKKEIQQYVKTHTAPYKYPRVVEFVTELPKTISGKIRRSVLRGDDKTK